MDVSWKFKGKDLHCTTISFDAANQQRLLSTAIGKGRSKFNPSLEVEDLFRAGSPPIESMNIAWGDCEATDDHEKAKQAAAKLRRQHDRERAQRLRRNQKRRRTRYNA